MEITSPETMYKPGHLPTEQAEEHHDGHFIDGRSGDQEGKGHTQRNTDFDKTDKERHRRARTERRDNPEHGRQHIAHALALAAQPGARLLRAEEGAQQRDQENHAAQQQDDFGHVVEKERQRVAQMRALWLRQQAIGNPVCQRLDDVVRRQPGNDPQGQQADHAPGHFGFVLGGKSLIHIVLPLIYIQIIE